MPSHKKITSSSLRRSSQADRLLSSGVLVMRPCSQCLAAGVLCILSPRDEHCEQCYRHNRKCDLASPWAEDDRLQKQEEELRERRLRAESEAIRLRKQERLLQKRRRELWAREKQNITELEVDEAAETAETGGDPHISSVDDLLSSFFPATPERVGGASTSVRMHPDHGSPLASSGFRGRSPPLPSGSG